MIKDMTGKTFSRLYVIGYSRVMGKDKPKLQPPSAAEVQLADLAKKNYARYTEAFRPLEKQAVADAAGLDSPSQRALYKGRSTADVAQAAAQNRPTGAPSVGAITKRTGLLADIGAKGQTATSSQLTDNALGTKANLVSSGRGLTNVAQNNLTNIASSETSKILAAERRRSADQASKDALVGNVAGMGLGTWGAKTDWKFGMGEKPITNDYKEYFDSQKRGL